MKKDLSKHLVVPGGINVSLDGTFLKVKGPEGELTKDLKMGKVDLSFKENKIILERKNATKNEKKIMNTNYSHIQNMIRGVQKKFEYHLKVCYVHFPFTLKMEGKKVMVKNFLGEKVDRVVDVPEGVEVELKKEIIIVRSPDKYLAGQASANFEAATRVRGRDRRIFQDGIYITEKDGKKI
ncbi:50S ribosomal protein L6 [Candidatus Pacearchaeota archaeon CG10_big_fil_rev_8_21_14_0_10_32_42]|nr:MAG: 50S ribosomal protein L6 [Candidatus Pacearchaeota archaeon CG10_big_fil_rev_8_21_14_0_10_32_42]